MNNNTIYLPKGTVLLKTNVEILPDKLSANNFYDFQASPELIAYATKKLGDFYKLVELPEKTQMILPDEGMTCKIPIPIYEPTNYDQLENLLKLKKDPDYKESESNDLNIPLILYLKN